MSIKPTVKTYSFEDHQVVLSHPDVGTFKLSDGGIGRVVIAYAGENSRHTTSADGSVVINKMKNKSGTVSIDVLQTSDANGWLKKYVNYLNNSPTSRFGLGRLVLTGVNGESTVCTGVTPQKMADVTYDAEATVRNWALLAADVTMK